MLLKSFALERKHKAAKRALQNRMPHPGYERGLMDDLTTQHLHDARKTVKKSGLAAPKAPSKRMLSTLRDLFGATLSSEEVVQDSVAYSHGRAIYANDVVLYQVSGHLAVGQVWFHMVVRNVPMTYITPWRFYDRRDQQCRCEVRGDGAEFVRTEALVESCIYSAAREGELSQILLPRAHRSQTIR